jgi:DUF4097 and DUF4098 domain-containing protein YvlB
MVQRVMWMCASIVLVLAGPAAAQNRNDRDRGPVETETVERTLSLQPGGEIRLTTFSGRVDIRAGGGNQVVVKAVRRASRERLDNVQLDITQSGNTVTIDANRRTGDRREDNVVETDFDIEVPAQVDLNVRTFSAPVTITGVSGDLDVEGFSAEIRLTDAAGPMRLKTFSGGIELQARDWMEGDDLDVTTFSGDITMRLPERARGNVTFDGFSGRLDSDLPLTLSSSGRRNVRGTLNGGGNTDFRFNTFSGSVRIRR